jgi:hypothetical protein
MLVVLLVQLDLVVGNLFLVHSLLGVAVVGVEDLVMVLAKVVDRVADQTGQVINHLQLQEILQHMVTEILVVVAHQIKLVHLVVVLVTLVELVVAVMVIQEVKV